MEGASQTGFMSGSAGWGSDCVCVCLYKGLDQRCVQISANQFEKAIAGQLGLESHWHFQIELNPVAQTTFKYTVYLLIHQNTSINMKNKF